MAKIHNVLALTEKDYNFRNIMPTRRYIKKLSGRDFTQKSDKNRIFVMLQSKELFTFSFGKGQEIVTSYGDAVFIPANVKVGYAFHCEHEAILVGEVCFDVYDEHAEQVECAFEPILFKADANQTLKSLFEKLYYNSSIREANRLNLRSHFLFFLNYLIASYSYNEHILIKPAIEYVEEHIDEKISVPQLAQICHLSESTFCRYFKRYTNGVPPAQFILRLKLGTALHYYETEQLTIEEIAERLNFCDASSLCKMYKKYMGTTLKNGKA